MADSPLKNSDGPLGVTIKLDGKPLADVIMIERVHVRHALNRIPEALFAVETSAGAWDDTSVQDASEFALGAAVEISAFYGDNGSQKIFCGIVTAQRLRITQRGGARLEVTCRDKAIALTETRGSHKYVDMTDSDVMSQIIGDAGLTADIAATSGQAPLHLRVAATDWDFLRLLADRNGHVIVVDDGKICSAPIDTGAAAPLTVTLGEDIVELDVSVDVQRMIGSAAASAWNEAEQQSLTGEGSLPKDGKFGNTPLKDMAKVLGERAESTSTAREMTEADLTTLAKARMARASLATIRGMVKFQGSGLIRPTDLLEISGTGDRFGGAGYVCGVEHEIGQGVWSTTVRMGLEQDWISDHVGLGAPPAGALTAPIHGLQIGKVMKVAEDPESKQRVLVSLPMICDPPAEVWARHATPYASDGAGIQFLPEVGDEVILAFLNADPNAPVIVGALHNAKALRPEEATTDNTVKTIKTASELTLSFDDENKIVTVTTPGGHKVTLDDAATSISLEDSNGNSIVLDAAGITIDSASDITMTATGNINAQATGDAKVTGSNVTCQGQMGFTGKGGASSEVSSGGQTTVKGSMVMIN